MEILSTLTGKSNVDIFGEIVTGKDCLTIVPPINIDSISDILLEAIKRFKSKLPKEFEWIDNISKVKDKDKELCKVLELELDEHLLDKNRSEEFWIGEPELVEWTTQIGYVFGRIKPRMEIHPTLVFENLKEHLISLGENLSCEVLKKLNIHIIKQNKTSYDSWSAFNYLYAKVTNYNETYILKNGMWYSVNNNFVASVDKALERIFPYEIERPEYNHEREDEYNEHMCKSDSACFILDKKLIHHGGNGSKFEFADILRNGTDLIHVKYYRSSSTLSHLFAQAYVSLELLVSDSLFRSKLNKVLPKEFQIADVNKRPDTQNYNIIYAIAINREIPKRLPFFFKNNPKKYDEIIGEFRIYD